MTEQELIDYCKVRLDRFKLRTTEPVGLETIEVIALSEMIQKLTEYKEIKGQLLFINSLFSSLCKTYLGMK